jgi:hypothetical protein
MVKSLLYAWRLWRLCSRLTEAQDSIAGCSMTIIVEGGASMASRIAVAKALGNPPPDPRTAAEVVFWPAGQVGQPGKTYHGHTLGEALGLALRQE